jgi:hypothetical protein
MECPVSTAWLGEFAINAMQYRDLIRGVGKQIKTLEAWHWVSNRQIKVVETMLQGYHLAMALIEN